MQVDKFLDELFLHKLRICHSHVERQFPSSPYEQVVLSLAMALDDRKRKIISVCDSDGGSIITANLPINYLYIFIGVEEGILNFEINDLGNEGTSIVVYSDVIGTALLKQDWGRGRRNVTSILNRTAKYLEDMAHQRASVVS